ncbi:MAG: DUF5060 domain-containing protein [Candidatus Micrarchaeota archaeon]
MRRLVPAFTLLLFLCTSAAADYQIPKHDVLSIDFVSTNAYSNPFDVDLTVTFTSHTQRQIVAFGFFEGDGNGGQTGNVWSVRFAGDEEGLWTYVTSSGHSSMDGLTGTVTVLPSANKGPIIVDPDNGHWFRYSEGDSVHLHGNFLDRVAGPDPVRWTHLYLSDNVNEAHRLQYLARARAIRANKMNIYLANGNDYIAAYPTNPWLGSINSPDLEHMNLAHWKVYEQEIARLALEGIVAELWFFSDGGFWTGSIPFPAAERYIKYAMSRLSAYNTMFVVALEWDEYFSQNEALTFSGYAQSYNPFGRPVSIHGLTGNFAFPNNPLFDFMATQAGNGVSYQGNYLHTRTNYLLPNPPKPLINEEFGFNDDDNDINMRRKLWMALVGGAAGTGTGSGLAEFDAFFDSLQPAFQRMSPRDTVLQSAGSDAHCLAETAVGYICFEPAGGTVTLSASEIAHDFAFAWFDPRAGTVASQGTVGPGNLVLSPPNNPSLDWVLYLASEALLPTCAEQGGYVCSPDEVCPGDQWLPAGDSDYCCLTQCEGVVTPTPTVTATPTATPSPTPTPSPSPPGTECGTMGGSCFGDTCGHWGQCWPDYTGSCPSGQYCCYGQCYSASTPTPTPSATPTATPTVTSTPTPSQTPTPEPCGEEGLQEECTFGECDGMRTCGEDLTWGGCVKLDLCCGVSCDDGNSCTADSCSAGVCSHAYTCGGGGGGGYSGGGYYGTPTPSPRPSITAVPCPSPTLFGARYVVIPESNEEVEAALDELPFDDEKHEVQEIISQAKEQERQGRFDAAKALWDKARVKIGDLLVKSRANKSSFNYWLAGIAAVALVGGAVYYSSTLHKPKPPSAADMPEIVQMN